MTDEEGTPPRQVEFTYCNWKGRNGHYVVQLEPGSLKFEPIAHLDGEEHWTISGDIITRDGDPRPEMGPTRRRTFIIDRISSTIKVIK